MLELNETLSDVQRLVNGVDARWPEIAASAVSALKAMGAALSRADAVLKSAQAVLSPSSSLYFEAVSTLREIRFAAAAAKVLVEYLQRNPSAILTGNH